MNKTLKVHEKFLYEMWKKQDFSKNLSTSEGHSIEVVDPGSPNNELGGPDFLNARIKIGNITYQGDVEIDTTYSDWKAHGHFINKKYNKVILHVIMNNSNHHQFVYTQDGRKVPSISLDKNLDKSLRENFQQAIISDRKNRINKMPCGEINELVSSKEKLNFLYELGIKRFQKKCDKMLERLKEIAYLKEMNIKEPIIRYDFDEKFYNREFTHNDFNDQDIWLQLFYESIFEALGYSKNKEIMQRLAKSVNIVFLNSLISEENFPILCRSCLI